MMHMIMIQIYPAGIQQNDQKVGFFFLPTRLFFRLVTSLSPFSMCFAKPRISKWDFPDATVPNSISGWEIWYRYFQNSHDSRTPHKTATPSRHTDYTSNQCTNNKQVLDFCLIYGFNVFVVIFTLYNLTYLTIIAKTLFTVTA